MKITIGVLNLLVGIILVLFIIVLQGISFFVVLGILYIVLGFRILASKSFKGLFLFGIVPLTILSIFSTIILGTKHVPEYLRMPFLMQIIFIVTFFSICLANYYFYLKKQKNT